MTATIHQAVLVREVLALLAPRSGGLYVDATVGGGGHTRALLEASAPAGRVVAVDRDPSAVRSAREALASFGDRVELHHARFSELPLLLGGRSHAVDGLVADLGISSDQLADVSRGMSWQGPTEAPLDLRMDPSAGEPASAVIARMGAQELADVLYRFGEERRSRAVARAIKAAPRMETTGDLVRAVGRVMPGRRAGRVHPATRSLQALRILVNDELTQIERLVTLAPPLLAPGGRMAIVSFHSLEDRIVKHALRSHPLLEVLTKKPIIASRQEIAQNPRARSAKLRGAERLA